MPITPGLKTIKRGGVQTLVSHPSTAWRPYGVTSKRKAGLPNPLKTPVKNPLNPSLSRQAVKTNPYAANKSVSKTTPTNVGQKKEDMPFFLAPILAGAAKIAAPILTGAADKAVGNAANKLLTGGSKTTVPTPSFGKPSTGVSRSGVVASILEQKKEIASSFTAGLPSNVKSVLNPSPPSIVSGGITFGKNQNFVWLGFIALIDAVLFLLFRTFRFSGGKRRR